MKLLDVRHLTKRFEAEGPPVVHDVTFDVLPHEIFALLGPSGCGKTTTLRTIAGFERAEAGEVRLNQRVLDGGDRHVAADKRGIGFVFQDYALFPHLDVARNVLFGLRNGSRTERLARVDEVLATVGLTQFKHRRPHELSGGQQQRVALARAIAPTPQLVLLDEPFSNLDAVMRQATREEVRALLKRAGMSAVLVTHDQEEALSFADRLAVMRNGRIEQVGTPEDVYYRPKTLFVAQFLGRTNLLFAEASGSEAMSAIGRLALDKPASGNVLLSIRPEHLTLVVPETDACAVCGEVLAREFKGHDITYRVQLLDRECLVHTDNRMPFQPGDRVAIRALEPAVVLEGKPIGPVTANGETGRDVERQTHR